MSDKNSAEHLSSLEVIRYDVRLASRPGWISKSELSDMLDSLPDVADKAKTEGD